MLFLYWMRSTATLPYFMALVSWS